MSNVISVKLIHSGANWLDLFLGDAFFVEHVSEDDYHCVVLFDLDKRTKMINNGYNPRQYLMEEPAGVFVINIPRHWFKKTNRFVITVK